MHTFFGHVFLREDACELACTVVAEIEENDGIAFFDFGNRPSVFCDYDRFDELVSDISIV